MKKKIVLITLLLSCIPLLVVVYKVYNYYDYQKYMENKRKQFDYDIVKMEDDILEKEKEITELKSLDDERIELLELWKKRIEKLR